MRLIDADDVKKMLFEIFDKEKDVISSYWVAGTLADKVDEIQTAYDVDKVVEQLEEEKKRAFELCLAINDKAQRQQYIIKEQAMALAIEIVKRWVE